MHKSIRFQLQIDIIPFEIVSNKCIRMFLFKYFYLVILYKSVYIYIQNVYCNSGTKIDESQNCPVAFCASLGFLVFLFLSCPFYLTFFFFNLIQNIWTFKHIIPSLDYVLFSVFVYLDQNMACIFSAKHSSRKYVICLPLFFLPANNVCDPYTVV